MSTRRRFAGSLPILALGLGLFTACSHLIHRRAPDPSVIDGMYLAAHDVEVNVPPVMTQTVSNCLRIRSGAAGKSWFELLLIWENDHSCSVSGEIYWSAGAFEFRPPPDVRDIVGPACRLRLRVTRTSVIVDDSAVDAPCRSYYCGQRALLRGEFSRKDRVPRQIPCPEAPMGFLEYYEHAERFLREIGF